MPLLEVIQNRQISASIRLDEATATLVDQYAAFIHASADEVVDKALNLCLRQRPRLSGLSEVSIGSSGCRHATRSQDANFRTN
jgi:hypothetical protein